MRFYILAAVSLLLGALLAWAAGLLHVLTGTPLLLVRVALVLLGLIGAGLLLWWKSRREAAEVPAVRGQSTPETALLDDLLAESERKLAGSQRSRAGRLNRLPLLFVLGGAEAGKTTTVLKCGLEPELLAGQVYREKDIVPTAVANLWYSERTVLLEAGDALRRDRDLFLHLLHRTQPRSWRSLFGALAPFRAAVVCVSAAQLLVPSSSEEMTSAAAPIAEQLREISRSLGAPLPVYVLVTKLDEVSGFTRFTRHLSPEEGLVLLGIAPEGTEASSGVYAERTTSALGRAFDRVVFSLASCRMEMLGREPDPANLPGVYQFPREFTRMRSNLTSFMLELGRPSQLNSSPDIRSFYFAGVRALPTQDAFSTPTLRDGSPENSTERTAQWAFLPRVLPQVVLGDDDALLATGSTSHATRLRQWFFAVASVLLLLYLAALTVSFIGNRALVRDNRMAIAALSLASPPPGSMASLEQLQALEAERGHLQQLTDWEAHHPPLHLRWGLYQGYALLSPARQSYFRSFRALLLEPTQHNLLGHFDALPATPAAGADYNHTYVALRTYLITTSDNFRSDATVAPVLLNWWLNGQAPEAPNASALAERQFQFYARVLPAAPPFFSPPRMGSVEHARSYLNSLGDLERIYAGVLAAAERNGAPVDFMREHPAAAGVIVEPHVVSAAFTPAGFSFVRDALDHPEHPFTGESWVLGSGSSTAEINSTLRAQIVDRYQTDYVAAWRAFVKDAAFVPGKSLAEAGAKLTTLSGNNSPLLALAYTVSRNTNVPDAAISSAFQASHTLVPATVPDQYIVPSNKGYVDSLLTLAGSIHQATDASADRVPDPSASVPISTAATAAHVAAQQTAQQFRVDAVSHLDSAWLALLQAPITSAERQVHGLGAAAANAGAAGLCSAFNSVFGKVPFNPKASVQATPAEVNALLAPGSGQLWKFYDSTLKNLVVPTGSGYAANPASTTAVNPAFLLFFNRSAALSQAFYGPALAGSTTAPTPAAVPTLHFTLRALPSPGITSSSIQVQRHALGSGAENFTWSAADPQPATMTANNLPLSFDGVWSIFLLMARARVLSSSEGTYELGFPLEVSQTPVRAADGTPILARFELSGPGAAVLAPGRLPALRCVPVIAR